MHFRKNDIIDYYDTRRIACGLILDVDDKRLRVLTDQGKETSIPQSRALIAGHDAQFPYGGSRDAQVGRLREITDQREAVKNTINLSELWEVVVPETSEIDVRELTELFFGSSADIHSSASLLRAVAEDRLYFRIRPDKIEVSDPDRVQQALTQRDRERERQEFIARCADFLADLRTAGSVDGKPVPEKLVPMLEEAARAGKEWITIKAVKEIFSRAGLPQAWDPFRVLVKLGIWSEDENVTLRTEGIPIEFSAEVEKRAWEAAHRPLPTEAEDLTSWDLITIDSEYTRDVDDALSLAAEGEDTILGVHITDVDHFIGNDEVLKSETISRATSIYLPEMTIPMIPPILSEEAASLTEGELRPALSLLVRVGPDLRFKDYRIVESIVRVKRRLSYEEADRRIEEEGSLEAALYRVALGFRRQRIAAGAVIFKDPELSVRVNEQGEIEVKVREREIPSQILVSEMMILANSLFARYLSERDIPAVYRSQPKPLEKIELGEEYDPVVSYRAKKALSRGDIGTQPAAHATLGLDEYTTATSPLRRCVDLIVQGQLKAAIRGATPPVSGPELERLVSEISYRLDRAIGMERERNRYFLLKHLESKRSEEFEAIVLQKFPRFHLVQIKQFNLNAALNTPASVTLSAYDRVLVRVDKINPRDDRLTLALVKLL